MPYAAFGEMFDHCVLPGIRGGLDGRVTRGAECLAIRAWDYGLNRS
jgi:hypothetical protein